MQEIIVDNFAGGGGASTGIEIAIGRSVDIAINHDPAAIAMHRANHPDTKHYTEDVWKVDPVEACEGRPVALAWFSPDCFQAGTLVLTDDGYKPIEDIRPGDYVLTHKNRWRAVTETMVSRKPVMMIRGYGHPGIVCSKKHPFYVCQKDTKGTSVFKPAETISAGTDYWGIPKMNFRYAYTPTGITEGDAWVAGRYVGDGWLRTENRHYETVITCGKQDIESLGSLLAEKSPGKKWNYRDVRTGGQFILCGREFCEWLLLNFGRLSQNKKIPFWLFTAAPEIKRAFLDGYTSADGYCKDELMTISTVSKQLAFGLVQLLATMGIPATVYYSETNTEVIEGRKVNAKPMWRVKWRSSIDADHVQHFEADGIIWRPIREVTDLQREETVYNISVEEDESYVADGIIVHNCKHFSRAKGSKPVSNKIRGLAWVAVKWAKKVRPRVIMLENVEEFQDWGRLRKSDSKPDPAYKGETFRRFVGQLKHLGYQVDYRLLRACDYGAPTTRKRFFLIARCDGRPIVWPEPTHGDPESLDVLSGIKKPWVPVRDCIDWTIPCPSIFASSKEIYDQYGIRAVRPLAPNTMKRIADGIARFRDKPFLIQYHSSREFRGQGVDEPLMTVDASNRYGLCMAFLTQFNNHCVGTGPDEPIPTMTAKSNHFGLIEAFLTSYYGGGGTVTDVSNPMPTQTSHDRFGLVTVYGDEYRITDIGLRMLTPRELFDAQGFPHDYIIDHDAEGNDYPRGEQVAKCGNAVCPPIPTALVRANLPELCEREALAV
ncbi:MAG: DNA cytosine methyltransferase [Lentisphaeria bacterium]|nr:DNA cytosine methyltransferase [Lentisphaeria bacterium]